MGLFDFLKKKDKVEVTQKTTPVKTTVPEEDKKFYQPDSYYTDVVHELSSIVLLHLKNERKPQSHQNAVYIPPKSCC